MRYETQAIMENIGRFDFMNINIFYTAENKTNERQMKDQEKIFPIYTKSSNE